MRGGTVLLPRLLEALELLLEFRHALLTLLGPLGIAEHLVHLFLAAAGSFVELVHLFLKLGAVFFPRQVFELYVVEDRISRSSSSLRMTLTNSGGRPVSSAMSSAVGDRCSRWLWTRTAATTRWPFS
jgi:hypothetical protein